MKPYNKNKREPKENTPLPNRRKKMFVLEYMWDGKPYDKLIWNVLKPEFKKL